MADADTVLLPRLLLPVAPENIVLPGFAVALGDGEVIDLGPRDEVLARHPDCRRMDLGEHLLMPGLVNAHGHLAMTLLRGLGEAEPLDAWLKNTIWPLEERWVGAGFVYDGARLAIAEMIATGTTAASDMYYFPEATARASLEAGFRLQAAFPILDMATAYARDVDEHFAKGLELHDQLRNEPLVTTCFGPHAPYTVQREHLERVAMLADETDIGVHMHLHETTAEVATAQREHGRTWIEHLAEIGLLNERLQAVHMTALARAEVERCAERGVRVIHCPHSNMKLASGVCPVPALLGAGAVVGLGTDGAASNNGLDLFAEARLAALLAKVTFEDAMALPAPRIVEMATLGGARALGLDAAVGSIELGKRADLVALHVENAAMQPLYDAHAQLVHSAAGAHVTHTFIDGRLVYENGAHLSLDIDDVLARAGVWRERIGGAP